MEYSYTSNAYDFDAFAPKAARASAVEKEAPVRKAAQSAKPANKAAVLRMTEKEMRRSHRHNAHMAKTLANLTLVMVVMGAIGAVVFSQVQLTELTDKVNTASASLTEQKSIAVQLEMQAAARMNTDEVETYARERLGMEKVTEGQTTYINLAQDDAGVVLQENEQPGVLKELWNTIRSMFS